MKAEQKGIIKCGDVFKEYCHLFLLEKILIKNLQKHKPFMHPQFGGIPFVWLFPPMFSLRRGLHLLTLASAWAMSLSHLQILPTSEEILPPIFQNVPNVLWSQGTPKELCKVLRSHTSAYIKQ